MAKTKAGKLGPKERIELYEAMKGVLKPSKTKEGMWKYDDGFNDKKIADITGRSLMQVVGVRNTLFGKVENAVGYVPIPELIKRLSALEASVAELKANLGG
jgi:hypothetical protein